MWHVGILAVYIVASNSDLYLYSLLVELAYLLEGKLEEEAEEL